MVTLLAQSGARGTGGLTREEILDAVASELDEPKYRLGQSWWSMVLDWLQRAWVRFLEWAARISEYVGGPIVLGLIVGAVVIALAVTITANLGRRRARAVDARIRREHEAARGLDPRELERAAAAAEEAGDFQEALRLYFRAGLVRLDRAGLIDLRPGTTSGTVAESVGSPEFGRLVTRFDTVVYGDKPAAPTDPALARQVIADILKATSEPAVS